jgi:TonB family protein
MPVPSYSKEDRYLRRLAIAAGVGALALVVATLLGPSPETVQRWILDRHIGAEGPTEILPNLDVIPDDMSVSQQRLEHMSSATEGLQVEEERAKPVPDAEKKVPQSAENIGQTGHAPLKLLSSERYSTSESFEESQEMHAPTQTSEDFVLEHYVEPRYPESASASAQARIVEVQVGMYVDPTGAIVESYIVSSDGGKLFDDAVLSAVRLWRYRPIVENPEGFWSQIAYRFGMDDLTPSVEMQSND